jgi:hypothetical protein
MRTAKFAPLITRPKRKLSAASPGSPCGLSKTGPLEQENRPARDNLQPVSWRRLSIAIYGGRFWLRFRIRLPSFVSRFSFFEFSTFLILLRQENRGYREVIVGDDPKLIARASAVARKDLKAALHAELVFLTVLRAQLSPIATRMAAEKLGWSLSRLFQGRQRGGRRYDLPPWEELLCDSFHEPELLSQGCVFLHGGTAKRCVQSERPSWPSPATSFPSIAVPRHRRDTMSPVLPNLVNWIKVLRVARF